MRMPGWSIDHETTAAKAHESGCRRMRHRKGINREDEHCASFGEGGRDDHFNAAAAREARQYIGTGPRAVLHSRAAGRAMA